MIGFILIITRSKYPYFVPPCAALQLNSMVPSAQEICVARLGVATSRIGLPGASRDPHQDYLPLERTLVKVWLRNFGAGPAETDYYGRLRRCTLNDMYFAPAQRRVITPTADNACAAKAADYHFDRSSPYSPSNAAWYEKCTRS